MCETIDSIVINFNRDNVLILNLCVAFIMFGVALDIEVKDFKRIFEKPKIPLVGLISAYLILPAITLGLIALFHPAPSFALGMILLTTCPGGSVSNYMVHLAKGNAALSVTLTSITTLFAVVITPLGFTLLAQIFPYTASFLRTIGLETDEIIRSIFVLIVVPLTTGMFCRSKFPLFTKKIKKAVSGLSMIIFLSFVMVAILSNWENIKSYVHCVFILIAIHNGLALLGGFIFANIMKLSSMDARTISIETGIQNTALGLVIAFQFFDGLGGMTMILAWWGIWHLITGFFMAIIWRRKVLFKA